MKHYQKRAAIAARFFKSFKLSLNLQRFLADVNFDGVASVFAEVVAELDHLLPVALLGDLGGRELHHDVHGLHVVDVACEVGADAVGVLHTASYSLVDGDSLIDVQPVAEDDGLLRRVDAEFLVFGNDFLKSLDVIAAVDA